MDENRATLAAEIAAELELTLPQATARLAEKLLVGAALRADLLRLGLARKLSAPDHATATLDVCGVAVSTASLPAFGGLLYGTATHAHRLNLTQHTIIAASEQARVKVGDLDFYESGQRLRWKATQCLFEHVGELLAENAPPRVILLDHSLFISRGHEGNREMLEEAQEEWTDMVAAVNGFWKSNLPRLFPVIPDGAIVASVSTQNALPLFVALHNNPQTSPDAVSADLPAYISTEWTRLRQAGMARLVNTLLPAAARTVAYAFEDLNLDPRWQPTELHHGGILGFFLRAGPQTPIWHVQVAGHRTHWTSERLDALASAICQATLGVGSKAEPLPLWYARRLAAFPNSMLEVYRDLARERMKDKQTTVSE